MSKPISTIVVQIRTSSEPVSKLLITFDISSFFNLPCAISILISGNSLFSWFFREFILPILFCTIKHWPPLDISLEIASLKSWCVSILRKDLMLNLLDGGVCKKENSFKPENIKFIVRGMGVADK